MYVSGHHGGGGGDPAEGGASHLRGAGQGPRLQEGSVRVCVVQGPRPTANDRFSIFLFSLSRQCTAPPCRSSSPSPSGSSSASTAPSAHSCWRRTSRPSCRRGGRSRYRGCVATFVCVFVWAMAPFPSFFFPRARADGPPDPMTDIAFIPNNANNPTPRNATQRR